jgi:hypothetical protein
VRFALRLRELLDSIDDALVTREARRRIELAGAPFAETRCEHAIECHLGNDERRADLVVRVFPDDRDALLAAGQLHEDVARFFERWRDRPELRAVPFVELEHDLDGEPQRPWVGPSIEPLVRRGVDAIVARREDKPSSEWESTRLAVAVLHELGERDERWRSRLDALFASLPPKGCINHLALGSTRPGRERAFVRVIASVRRFDVAPFLSRVGWRGDLTRLERLLDRHFRGEGRTDLDLDVELDGCAVKTAAYADFRAPRASDSSLRAMLARVVDDRLASAAAIDSLSRWIARSDASPARVLTMKLADDGRRATTKAYLGSLREGWS